MSGRRGNGEGTIRKRTDNRWEARYYYIDLATGEIQRGSTYGRTRNEARAAMREALDRVQDGAPPKDASITLGSWIHTWLTTSLEASSRRKSTKRLYHTLSAHLIAPPLGAKRLDRLRPSDIEALIVQLRARPGKRRIGRTSDGSPVFAPLTEATVQRTFVLLRLALDGAVRDGLLAKNPARAVQQPTVQRKEAHFLTTEQVLAVLADARQSRSWPVLLVIAMTGMRRGEALALRWDDVDFEASALQVRRSLSRIEAGGGLVTAPTKTAKSRRTVPMSPALADMLRQHRKAQAAERLRAGASWQDNNLVFATEAGGPVEPRNVLRAIARSARRVGIEHPVGLHTLRHAAATTMIERGANLKAVADLLGHADIRTTANIYGHVTDAAARAAMDSLGAAFGGATSPRRKPS